MAFEWKEVPDETLVRDPLVEFILNGLRRFTIAELGLNGSADDLDYDNQVWLTQVSLARDGETSQSIDKFVEKAEDIAPNSLLIPGEYSAQYRERTDLDVITVYAKRALLDAAIDFEGARKLGVSATMIAGPFNPDTLVIPSVPFVPKDPEIKVSKDAVVTAVIDYGIAIAHDLFRRDDNGVLRLSRVDFFYDMEGTPVQDPEIDVTMGRVWTRNQIQGVLDKHFHNGLLDEAAVYRELGLINWDKRALNTCAHRLSHGTHVAGLAAGYEASDPTGEDRPIIAVQLPSRLVADTIGQWMEFVLAPTLEFIGQRIEKYKVKGTGADVPLVMNFSFGSFFGPHDGTGSVERAVDQVLTDMEAKATRSRVLMLPTGNGNLSRCHAEIDLSDTEPTAEIDWVLQPDDRSPSYLYFWLPRLTPVPDGAVTLEIDVPGTVGKATVTAGMQTQTWQLFDTPAQGTPKLVGYLSYSPPEAPTFRGFFVLQAVPTFHQTERPPYAPFGAWKMIFTKGNMVDDLTLNGWVKRDETLPGFPPGGRQPYLSASGYRRFEDPGGRPKQDDFDKDSGMIRRAGMISGIACGNLPGVVAGYVRSDRRMAAYSAGGPTQNPNRQNGPDCSAVSDDSVALSGVLSAGSSSGSRVPMNGTSVATPQIARWAADQLAASPTTPFNRADLYTKGMADDPPDPGKPRAIRTGGGRVELPSIFGSLRWQRQ